jgi:hypothetical protein
MLCQQWTSVYFEGDDLEPLIASIARKTGTRCGIIGCN